MKREQNSKKEKYTNDHDDHHHRGTLVLVLLIRTFQLLCSISLGSTGKRLLLSREFCYLLMMEKLLGLCGLISLSLFYLGCSLHQTNYESLSFSVCEAIRLEMLRV